MHSLQEATMTQAYTTSLWFLSGIISGSLLVFVIYVESFDNFIFTKTLGFHDTGDPNTESINETRKLIASAKNTKYTHKEGQVVRTDDDVMCNCTNVKTGASLAEYLYNHTRVLCWVMTCDDLLGIRAVVVRDTWAKRCNKVIFVSDENNATFPAIGLGTLKGRSHLTAKTMKAFDYIYRHHIDDADWFMKADDDTYVILENLRYLLSEYSPNHPIFFGYPFKVLVRQGYFSGGAGYVLSRAALERFGNRDRDLCSEDGGSEDVELGKCMEKLNVSLGDSRDRFGKSRFHCFSIEDWLGRRYPSWIFNFSKYNPNKTEISDYPISFHYVNPEGMRFLEYYVYHLKVYGHGIGGDNWNITSNIKK